MTWTTPDGVADALRDDTCLVVTETPTNPTLALVDIEGRRGPSRSVPVLVDSTFATPCVSGR